MLLSACGKDEEHVRREETSGQTTANQTQPPRQIYVPVYVPTPAQQQWPQQPPQWGTSQWPAQSQPQQSGGYGTAGPQYGTQQGYGAAPQYGSQQGYGAAPQYVPQGGGYGGRLEYNAQPQPWGSPYQPGGTFVPRGEQGYSPNQYRPLDEKAEPKSSGQWTGNPPQNYYGSPYGYGAAPYGGWPGYYGGSWPGAGFPFAGGFPGGGWPLAW